MTYDLPRQECLHCGFPTDRATSINSDHRPQPGMVTICWGCNGVTVLDDNCKQRLPTPEEAEQINRDPSVTRAQLQRASLVNEHPLRERRKL